MYRTTISLRTFQRPEYLRNILKPLLERHKLCVLLVITLKPPFFSGSTESHGTINLPEVGLMFPLKTA